MATPTLERTAERLAALLGAPGTGLRDPSEHSANLIFEADAVPRPLERLVAPGDVWAVDGGQALVADARCLQVLVTRAARVRFRAGRCTSEEEGELRAHLLGGADERVAAVESLELDGIAEDTSVDVNLLRDRWEWDAVRRCVEEAEPGAMVLVDGDLQPDWRIPSSFLGGLLRRADERGVVLAGITKHSSLARGGAPLLGLLELEAAKDLGPRAVWWAPVARTRASARTDTGAGLQVVAARLDPDARFAFRIDLPAGADAAANLGRLAALCDDAAFPGYPYPLTVADRLAACPGWLRSEAWLQLDELLARAGVSAEVRDRAFTDRHRLMERS
jgi:hypothetical protein